MDLKTYLDQLPNKQARERFAKRADTSLGYLDHLKKGRKLPMTLDVILKLIAASDGELTLEGLRPDLFGSNKAGRKRLAIIRSAPRAAA